MATRVAMPKFGLIMTEGQVVKWIKGDGERVTKGEHIAVIMSKKITYQLEAPADGILRYVARLKESVPCGQAIGFILAEGEAMPQAGAAVAAAAAAAAVAPAAPPTIAAAAAPAPATPAGAAAVGTAAAGGFISASPAARRVAKELGVELAQVAGTGPEGRISEDDVKRYAEARARQPQAAAATLATSAARQLAEARGVDLARVTGTGIGGRITEADVQAAFERQPTAIPPATAAAAPVRGARTVPFAGMRLAIAQNMVESLRTMAQVTSLTEVDVTELVKLREQIKTKFSLTYTDLIIKAVAIAIRQHPLLNATLAGEEIVLLDEIHVGMAVALEEGLIVPAVRNADRLTLAEIAAETRRLAEAARTGTLGVDDAVGSTFTVTNLGTYGIDHSTPVINPPEVAILGVGRIIEKPAIFEGQIAKRSMLGLSLTFDHRVVDGAPAAAFLKSVCELLEKPYLLFV